MHTITESTQSAGTARYWLTEAGLPEPVAQGMILGAQARPGRVMVTPPFVASVQWEAGRSGGPSLPWHPAVYTVSRPAAFLGATLEYAAEMITRVGGAPEEFGYASATAWAVDMLTRFPAVRAAAQDLAAADLATGRPPAGDAAWDALRESVLDAVMGF